MNVPEEIECQFDVVQTDMLIVGLNKVHYLSEICLHARDDPVETSNQDFKVMHADSLLLWLYN